MSWLLGSRVSRGFFWGVGLGRCICRPTNSLALGREVKLISQYGLCCFDVQSINDSVTNEVHKDPGEEISAYAAARTQTCSSRGPGGACPGSVEISAHALE